ncbi:MAG: hypothetical protein Q8L39_13260 [Burkholderiales bacterium]|nr:hypothetical protein [Burkholderiales bacterium]
MIPANVNPLLMAGNADPLDEYRVIKNSVRFNIPDAAYLTRTPASSGNRKTWTWSGWLKRSTLGSEQDFWNSTNAPGLVRGFFRFNATDKLYLSLDAATASLITTAAYRDLAAHMHVHLLVDTTQAVAADRFKLWINGVQVTAGTFNYPALNADTEYNIGTQAHTLSGSQPYVAEYFGGYISEVYFIDGQALAPTSFGVSHPKTNQWRPKRYSGTYGTNGFYLDFFDASAATAAALGADRSGNGNNWTPTNISVTAGAGNDCLTDTPTNNFCVWNPLSGAGSLSNGALENLASYFQNRLGTVAATSGKIYFEGALTQTSGNGPAFGVCNESRNLAVDSAVDSNAWGLHLDYVGGSVLKTGGGVQTAVFGAPSASPIVGVAVDLDARKVWLRLDGVWVESGDPATAINPQFSGLTGSLFTAWSKGGDGTTSWALNSGQRPFAYTPPTGFKALCTKNLSQTSAVTVSGSFTGNAAADGPCVHINGSPETLTINSNAVTYGTHADRLAGGFKLRTASASYNTAGANTWTATIVSNIKNIFRHQNARGN